MARVTTETGVSNLCLTFLKQDAVTNIETGTGKAERLCNLWFDDSRRETLAESDWDCAIKRVELAAESTAPDFGYSHKYLLPADYIRLSTIGDEDDPETDFKVEDGYLHINESGPIDVRYVYDQTDITKWSPKLLMAIAKGLAKNICYALTGNRTFAAELEVLWRDYISDAKGVDGQQTPPKKVQRSRWKLAKETGHRDAFSSGRIVT